MTSLFEPIRVGDLLLPHRVVMAPLTRNRAPGGMPVPLMATYYAQRADPERGAALILTEASQIEPLGQGYLDTPGIHSDTQVAAWRQVTDAVHARGGRIALQLWHVGRISHVSLLPPGDVPVAPSAIAAATKTFTAHGFEPCSAPRALRADELPALVQRYARAAGRAMDAGFDAVEVHGANGYLIDQFLRDSTNHRDDAWGGPIAHRCRLLVEVMQAVSGAIGAGRTGLRLSPVSPVNDAAVDSDPQALYAHAMAALAPLKLAWIDVVEGTTGGARDAGGFDFAAMRAPVADAGTAWMVNNGYTREMALTAVSAGAADLVAFGRAFIANPDLTHRLRHGLPLAEPDRKTFYGGGAAGYTDYPALP
jgi:N-ethylmaleimide reductase